jgi:hypothetical protein
MLSTIVLNVIDRALLCLESRSRVPGTIGLCGHELDSGVQDTKAGRENSRAPEGLALL